MRLPKIESLTRYTCRHCLSTSEDAEEINECEAECVLLSLDSHKHAIKPYVVYYLSGCREHEFSSYDEASEALVSLEHEIDDANWMETSAFGAWEGNLARMRKAWKGGRQW
jgi:hypothetical protein